jgi:hypothetical protein
VRFINEPFREGTDDDEGSNGIEVEAPGGELEDPVGEQRATAISLAVAEPKRTDLVALASWRFGSIEPTYLQPGHTPDDDSEARADDYTGR